MSPAQGRMSGIESDPLHPPTLGDIRAALGHLLAREAGTEALAKCGQSLNGKYDNADYFKERSKSSDVGDRDKIAHPIEQDVLYSTNIKHARITDPIRYLKKYSETSLHLRAPMSLVLRNTHESIGPEEQAEE